MFLKNAEIITPNTYYICFSLSHLWIISSFCRRIKWNYNNLTTVELGTEHLLKFGIK